MSKEYTTPNGIRHIQIDDFCCPACGGTEAVLILQARGKKGFKVAKVECSTGGREGCQMAVYEVSLSIDDVDTPEAEAERLLKPKK